MEATLEVDHKSIKFVKFQYFINIPFRRTIDSISRSDDTVILNKQKTCTIYGGISFIL
jgi:hypothetical protein